MRATSMAGRQAGIARPPQPAAGCPGPAKPNLQIQAHRTGEASLPAPYRHSHQRWGLIFPGMPTKTQETLAGPERAHACPRV